MKPLFFIFLIVSAPLCASPKEDSLRFYAGLKERLAETEGLRHLPRVQDKAYRDDCSGYISFVFHWAGLDLLKHYGVAPNGVSALWLGLGVHGFEVPDKNLQPGDIVFFHNTVDRNKNQKRDDAFTHIGVVETIEANGTAVFLHFGSKGVARARLNLRAPDLRSLSEGGEKTVFNDFLRRGSGDSQNLAGSLYGGAMRLKLQSAQKVASANSPLK